MAEKEYIERAAILACYQMDDPVLNEVGHVPLPIIRQNIMDIPAADVALVVRCKDCKHFETPYCMLCKTRIGAGYWSHDMAYRKPDDFCSYGERKEGDPHAQ